MFNLGKFRFISWFYKLFMDSVSSIRNMKLNEIENKSFG